MLSEKDSPSPERSHYQFFIPKLSTLVRRASLPYESIIVEAEPPVGVIRLNRPKAMNALSFGVLREIVDALEAFDKDDRIKVSILTGNDDAFSAGADIKELSEATPVDLILRNQFALWDRLKKTVKPIIGAVSGYAPVWTARNQHRNHAGRWRDPASNKNPWTIPSHGDNSHRPTHHRPRGRETRVGEQGRPC